MNYNFDQVNDRERTASKKWDTLSDKFGSDSIIPMWVADMDFKSPERVVEALKERADQGIFGYTIRPDSYLSSIMNWFEKRHHWSIEKEWITHSPGIIPALSLIINKFTQASDKILVQSPVHHAFYRVIRSQGRGVVESPLKLENGRYQMDFEDLEQKIDSSVKMMILCSPHNPIGRVWSKEELIRLGEICVKHNILIVSDEVFCDLVFKDQTHIPFASISEEFAQHSITCVAPSKTFNLVGLKTSSIIIPNEGIRAKFDEVINAFSLAAPNYFGVVALENAYRYGDEWLDQLIDYLYGNLQYLKNNVEENLPNVHLIQPEGTYLAWLDFRDFGLSQEELNQLIVNESHVGFDAGSIFGTGGTGFMRMNYACPRATLKTALNALEKCCNQQSTTIS
ncbi:MalY/PatB family protein [Lentibacillus sp. Marseille-P4043]|uniref:MalY/PatB family protein n=1 Tax=Lentibacillus sp. Marseille-P4043 TaxID=2040293 RepID=UPI000D0AFE7C|nr:MalY/PatB family protein [Lentibacillus sp. Marseille-P4043]